MMEDDDDPYGTGEASSSSLAFAFDNLAEADDDIVVMGQPAPTARPGESKTKQPGATDTWHDGRPVLPGFVLDPLSAPTDKWSVNHSLSMGFGCLTGLGSKCQKYRRIGDLVPLESGARQEDGMNSQERRWRKRRSFVAHRGAL